MTWQTAQQLRNGVKLIYKYSAPLIRELIPGQEVTFIKKDDSHFNCIFIKESKVSWNIYWFELKYE